MEQYTTYTVKSRNSPNIWQFKFHLNGTLAEFNLLEGTLTEKQINWLSSKGHFPFYEAEVKNWQSKLSENFEIIVGEPDLSFDALWSLHNHKVSKAMALKAFNKLKPADIILCFLGNERYQKYIATKPNLEKMHLATFINQRRWEDEYPIAEPQPAKGPNYNNALKDLANRKTEK